MYHVLSVQGDHFFYVVIYSPDIQGGGYIPQIYRGGDIFPTLSSGYIKLPTKYCRVENLRPENVKLGSQNYELFDFSLSFLFTS